MTDGIQTETIGYSPVQISEIVEKDLKSPSSLTPKELNYLKTNKKTWYSELVNMKKRTEFQLTSSKTRQFSLYKDKLNKKLTEIEYVDKLQVEKTWRCNATKFVQQIESRLSYIKTATND
jgi:hypothetical protein